MNLNDPIFTDETKARAYFEGLRWPDGPYCPHCGEAEKVYRLEGKSHRPGLFTCNGCNGAFTVTTGGVMESSHIPLTKWALGFRLYAASKKGFSAHQLHRQLGITYKSAWFMAHRIREAMAPTKTAAPLGGAGKVVEADESYTGRKKGAVKKGGGGSHKMAVVALVERGGPMRSFHVERADKATVIDIITKNVKRESRLHTDESSLYTSVGTYMAKHETVVHKHEEYARGDVTTNSVEGVFSVLKRGLIGTYQHVSEQHLHRYLAEFDFRQNNRIKLGVNDDVRTERAIKGAEGKRLTYQQSSSA